MDRKWVNVIIIMIFLVLVAWTLASIADVFSQEEDQGYGNVALIQIKGEIVSDESGGFYSSDQASSTEIVELIEKADKNPQIKAIILEINSPGGTPVATKEIARAIEKTNKTTVAWIREIGTSGAYWVASSCDVIVADELSITGSIGVQGSYLEFSGLLERYNVTYERMVAGRYKDIGSSYKELSDEERLLMQNILDKMHESFIQAVAKNRNLEDGIVRQLSTGMFYIGSDAKEYKLVDVLGGKDEAIDIIRDRIGEEPIIVKYENDKTFLEMLQELSAEHGFSVGRGIGTTIAGDGNPRLQ